jgi:DNA mismatch repair protein MutH
MHFKLSQYEFKDSNRDDWQEVSETIVLGKLVDVFGRLTPLLSEMLQGKEIITPEGIFRMKNCGNGGKDY